MTTPSPTQRAAAAPPTTTVWARARAGPGATPSVRGAGAGRRRRAPARGRMARGAGEAGFRPLRAVEGVGQEDGYRQDEARKERQEAGPHRAPGTPPPKRLRLHGADR